MKFLQPEETCSLREFAQLLAPPDLRNFSHVVPGSVEISIFRETTIQALKDLSGSVGAKNETTLGAPLRTKSIALQFHTDPGFFCKSDDFLLDQRICPMRSEPVRSPSFAEVEDLFHPDLPDVSEIQLVDAPVDEILPLLLGSGEPLAALLSPCKCLLDGSQRVPVVVCFPGDLSIRKSENIRDSLVRSNRCPFCLQIRLFNFPPDVNSALSDQERRHHGSFGTPMFLSSVAFDWQPDLLELVSVFVRAKGMEAHETTELSFGCHEVRAKAVEFDVQILRKLWFGQWLFQLLLETGEVFALCFQFVPDKQSSPSDLAHGPDNSENLSREALQNPSGKIGGQREIDSRNHHWNIQCIFRDAEELGVIFRFPTDPVGPEKVQHLLGNIFALFKKDLKFNLLPCVRPTEVVSGCPDQAVLSVLLCSLHTLVICLFCRETLHSRKLFLRELPEKFWLFG